MWKAHPAILGLWKFSGPNLRPKTQSTRSGIRICRLTNLRIPVFFVNVAIAFPSSLILTDASTSRRAISPTLWGNSLASLGRALRVRKTAVCRDHFQLHAWWARTTITR
jgi:hypothetical protein